MRFVSWFLDGSFEIHIFSDGYDALEADIREQLHKGRILIRCYPLSEQEKAPSLTLSASIRWLYNKGKAARA